ncbi:MAG TPA: hypothetical protein VES01_06285, partial [Dermatophilaceae bacterium]|nr:hypothetical protein [Dermatophilaceae bacterium]
FSTRLFRAAVMAVVLGMTVVIGALVWVGVLAWWTLAVSVAVIGAVLAWLPRAAHAERLARNRRRRARHYLHPRTRRRMIAEAAAQAGVAATGRRIQQDAAGGARSDEGPASLAGASAGSAESRPDSPRASFGRRHHRGAERPFDLLADGGGWTPVPVPPPTYTLKARAPQSASVAGRTAAADRPAVVPVPIDIDDDLDDVAGWIPRPVSRTAAGG